MDVAGTVVIGQHGSHAQAYAHLHHGNHHAGAPGSGHSGNGTGAIRAQQLIAEGGGQACEDAAEPIGKPQKQNLGQQPHLTQSRTEVETDRLCFGADGADVQGASYQIAQNRGQGSTGHTRPQHQNEQRVQNQVRHRACNVIHHGPNDDSLAPYRGGNGLTEQHERRPRRQSPQIRRGIRHHILRCPQQMKQGRGGGDGNGGEYRTEQQAGPDAHAARSLRLFLISRTEGVCQNRTPACAQGGADGCGETEHRPNHRYGGNRGVIAQHTDKKHICHVVKHHDQNGEYRRNCQLADGFPNRFIPKQLLVAHDKTPLHK